MKFKDIFCNSSNGEDILKSFKQSDDINYRREFLKDEYIKDIFFMPKNHIYFIKLIHFLSNDELAMFVDDYFAKKIQFDDNSYIKLNALVLKINPIINTLKDTCPKLIDVITDNLCAIDLSRINIDFALLFLNKDFSLSTFSKFSDDVQQECFNNPSLSSKLAKLIIDNHDNKEVFSINIDIINQFINLPEFTNVLEGLSFNAFNGLILRGLVIPNYMLHNQAIINKYLDIKSINFYRETVEHLVKNNFELYVIINSLRNRKYDVQVLSQKSVTSRDFIEMIVDKYFKDVAYNFLKNLKQMLHFIKTSRLDVIPEERLKMYRDIVMFESLSIAQRKQLYSSLDNGLNYVEIFYDDYRACKDASYELMNEVLLKPTDLEYNLNSSNKYGVPVYDMAGEDFFALVHITCRTRNDSGNATWFSRKFSTTSLSLINSDMFNTYLYPRENVILGFTHLNEKQIMHVYNSDSYSSNDLGTNNINKIYTPDKLIEQTLGYNEILYLEYNQYDGKIMDDGCTTPLPQYVLAYDYITQSDVNTAFALKIPIIRFYTKFYDCKETEPELTSEKYLLSSEIDKKFAYYR